tara:strand:+ start:3770 stop:4006 length:237 start_codon:yes stop_codon:yes gene_type:complete
MHIVRKVDHKGAHKILMQGEVVNGIIEPTTVRVFTIWANFAGVEQIGPELMTDNKAGKCLAMQIATHLTKQYKEASHD